MRRAVILSLGLWLHAGAIAGFPHTLEAARDSVMRDVSVNPDSLERLTEQLGEAEESPLLEFLEDIAPRTSIETRSRVSRKLQPARGFREGKYAGTAVKSYQRVRMRYEESVQAGILLEKDAGETRLDDFVAGYLQLRDVGPVRAVILGDYFIEAGQGIALWRAYDFQKGTNIVAPVVRARRGLVPYASSDENGFFSGIASTVEIAEAMFTAFFSRRHLSGTLDTAGNVTNLYTSGYFRTPAEEEKRKTFTETVVGFHGNLHITPLSSIGITGYTAGYGNTLNLSGVQPGNRFTVFSADMQASIGSARIFTEWGIAHGATAGITGIHMSAGDDLGIVAAYRNYQPGFVSLHGNSFGERQGVSNERGWYMGLSMRPVRSVRISSYFDLFSFPQNTSGTVFQGGGREVLVESDVAVMSGFLVTPRYRRKVTIEKGTGVNEFGRLIFFDDQKTDQDFRLTVEYSLSSGTKLRSRIQYTDIKFNYLDRREHGILFYQDAFIQQSDRLRWNARVVFFRTDSFDSGIAEYERDLDGVLTVPILYGRGVRWYLLVHYAISDILRSSVKYAELIREDVKTIGSGFDELPGNRDNRISLQLDCSL